MLYTEPHAGTLPITQVIAQAHHLVAITAYEIDAPEILDAIRGAVRRGVTVQVIIAPHPQGRPVGWARAEFRRLVAAGAQVRWSPYRFTHHYAREHARYLIDDDGHGPGLISDANLTRHALVHGRDMLWLSHEPAVIRALAEVFDADWTRQHAGAVPRRILMVSPSKSRPLARLLSQPGAVDLESRKFGYLPRVIHALEHKGREARIILPASLSAYDHGNLKPILHAGVQVRYLRGLTPHGTVIAGNTLGFIGSQNLSWSSLHSSRDVGIILHGRSTTPLRAEFDRDWRRASPVA